MTLKGLCTENDNLDLGSCNRDKLRHKDTRIYLTQSRYIFGVADVLLHAEQACI